LREAAIISSLEQYGTEGRLVVNKNNWLIKTDKTERFTTAFEAKSPVSSEILQNVCVCSMDFASAAKIHYYYM